MKKYSQSILKLFILLVLLNLVSCNEQSSTPILYKIGFSQCSNTDSWRKEMEAGMQRELSFSPEISMITEDGNGNSQTQIRQIQSLIDKKVDLIIVSPNEADPLTAIVEKAYNAGIPVILIDRRINSEKFTAFVGADNYLVGQNAGNYANILLKEHGNIIEIGSGPNTSPSIGRHTGFVDALKKHPNIHVVETLWGDETNMDTLTSYLKSKIPPHLIFVHNDRMAFSVYKTCVEVGLSKKIKIIGVDGLAGENEGLDLVRTGKLTATILYPTGGEEAIRIALKILKQQAFQKENNLFTTVIDSQNVNIMLAQYQKVKQQQNDIERQAQKIKDLNATYSSQRNRIYFMTGLLSVVILMGTILFYLLREKQFSNRILEEQNHAISEQKDEIEKVSLLAQQATEEKMRFYSYISHEFRTPLSLILTPAEDLLQRKSINVNDIRTMLQFIRKNANRLLRLVDQLLELRKIDAGKMTLEAEPHDLVAFIKDIAADFKLKAQNQAIDLQFICGFDSMPLMFDAEKLDKVLFNILSNAFKFTPKNGLIHITLLKNVDKIDIVIADNGLGMSEEGKAHAFDLFYRGNHNLSLGTGLGLALSHEYVNLHQGKIILVSELGKGTTFRINLPNIQPPLLSQPNQDPKIHFNHLIEIDEYKAIQKLEKNAPSAIKNSVNENAIVLIEDNADLNAFLKQKLQLNYIVFSTETAEAGWEEILAHIPDIIISDVVLPGMDGFVLTKKIKNDFRTSHIPVILLTAKSLTENQIEGTKAGADIYIPKPFNQQLLEERVKNLLENRDKMRRRFSNEITNPNLVPKNERKFLVEFESMIEKNLKDGTLTVENLSHALGMSRVQLFRKISGITNKNVIDYISEFKLQKAKVLLKNSEKTIAEIAYETGFSNPSYFTTFFKQKTNQTPSEWRNG